MDHRIIGLIIAGCIIFVSVIAIIIKYFLRHKKTKIKKAIEKQTELVLKNEEEKQNSDINNL